MKGLNICIKYFWRDKLISLLKIDYFNPVVDDWTPDCQDEERRQKKICDLQLYVITPKMTGTFSIAELIDSSNKNPKGTVFMIIPEDGGLTYDEGQRRSLEAVSNMARANGLLVLLNLLKHLRIILIHYIKAGQKPRFVFIKIIIKD